MEEKELKYPLPKTVKEKNNFYVATGIWVRGDNWTKSDIEAYEKWMEYEARKKAFKRFSDFMDKARRTYNIDHHTIPTIEYTPYNTMPCYAPIEGIPFKKTIDYVGFYDEICKWTYMILPFAYMFINDNYKSLVTLRYQNGLEQVNAPISKCKSIDFSSPWWDTDDGKVSYCYLFSQHRDEDARINRYLEYFEEMTSIKTLNNELFNIPTHRERIEKFIGSLRHADVVFNKKEILTDTRKYDQEKTVFPFGFLDPE